jgi:hypothetical protein
MDAAGAAGVASSGYGVAFSHMKICMESTYAIAGCAPAALVASTPYPALRRSRAIMSAAERAVCSDSKRLADVRRDAVARMSTVESAAMTMAMMLKVTIISMSEKPRSRATERRTEALMDARTSTARSNVLRRWTTSRAW